ncbi:Cys-Gln thioester bond-forming surface protein [Streptomyces sp. NPDC051018]|uniref:Cys-Gln thioester bond-forming surface protein n=1 Tax=Streptomyces sp. NPDC051018 TaxID=3365639 RepID=UPI0037A07BD7
MGLLACVVLLAPGTATAAIAAPAQDDGTVYIGAREGYSGTGIFPVYSPVPANPAAPGEPSLWAYCIEHNVSPRTKTNGTVGELGSYLGANYFTDPAVQSKVLWVLAHSYPALSLEEFGAAAGATAITRNDAIEATQYAIWRYTDLNFDAPWAWETPASETAYWYLVNGANASTGTTPPATTTISISAPSTQQDAGTLVGPFVVTTNQPTVSVSVDPAAKLTDANGTAVDRDSVVNGQALYLDLRGTKKSGTATITATAAGSAINGKVVSVPTEPGGTPTAANHAQSIILVAASGATTSAEAVARWNADEDDSTGGGNGTGGNTTGGNGTGGGNGSGGNTTGGDSSTGGGATGATAGGATPSAEPSVSVSPTSGRPLAETGSSGTGLIMGIAAALAVVGGVVLFTVRRRRSARH